MKTFEEFEEKAQTYLQTKRVSMMELLCEYT